MTRKLALAAAALGLMLAWTAAPASAAWIGATSGSTDDALHSYLTTANWDAGVSATFDQNPAGGTRYYFSADWTATSTWVLSTASSGASWSITGGGTYDAGGSQSVTAADHVVKLDASGGGLSAVIKGSGGTLTLGNATAGSGLALDLNGAVQSFYVSCQGNWVGSNRLLIRNSIINTGATAGGIVKTGDSVLQLAAANAGLNGGTVAVNQGFLKLTNLSALGDSGSRASLSLAGGAQLVTNFTDNQYSYSPYDLQSDVTVTGTGTAKIVVNLDNGSTYRFRLHTFGDLTMSGGQTLFVDQHFNHGVRFTGTTTIAGSNTIVGNGADVVLSGQVTGTGSLTLKGNGGTVSGHLLTVTLDGAGSDYSGGTTIAEGAVKVTGDGSLGAGDVTVSGGTLYVQNSAAIDDAASLYLAGGKVNLAAGVDEAVAALYFDGIAQAGGTWGSTSSSATNQDDTRFAGTGILTVPVPEPATVAFLAIGGLAMAGGAAARRRRK